MNGFGFGFSAALGTLLNPTPEPPEGYEALKDSTGADIKDSTGTIIYVLQEV